MNAAAVLAEFDRQMRRDPAREPGSRIECTGQVTRVVPDPDGWAGVLWTGLTGETADAVIAEQLGRFGGLGQRWEWKHYSYDQPADLPARLLAAGFLAGDPEALLVAEITDLDLTARPPDGITLVPVTGQEGADAVVRVHDEVFGGQHAATGARILAGLATEPHPAEAVVAMASGTPVSAARVEFPAGRDFAGLWGGGTVAGWRGRGIFRSLVAYRARLARDRGYRYLQVDASPDSRPILRRLGFAELATTTPYLHNGS
jgi:hypothetical protein